MLVFPVVHALFTACLLDLLLAGPVKDYKTSGGGYEFACLLSSTWFQPLLYVKPTLALTHIRRSQPLTCFWWGAPAGLILAPMLAAPTAARGLPFLPSMSVGIFVASPLVTALLSGPRRAASVMRAAEVASAPGMTAGAVWQAGNMCSIVAVQDPRVGLAVSLAWCSEACWLVWLVGCHAAERKCTFHPGVAARDLLGPANSWQDG